MLHICSQLGATQSDAEFSWHSAPMSAGKYASVFKQSMSLSSCVQPLVSMLEVGFERQASQPFGSS